MIKQNSLLVCAIAAITMTVALHAGAQAADKTVSIDQLGDVLAKVDGKPVRKAEVYPTPIGLDMSLQNAVKPAIAQYINQMLAAQAAVTEGLDKTAAYRDGMAAVEQRAALVELTLLAQLYESRLPAIVAAQDRAAITDTQAAAYVKLHPDRFRDKTRREAIRAARPHVARDNYFGAQIDWMTKHLTQPMTINGEAIPADTISEAIDAADARYWIPTPELLEAVIKMVIRQEAKASGDNRKDIRADAGRVQDLIAAARLGIGDQQFALGNDPNLRSVLEMIEPADMPKLQAVVLILVKNIVMAKQARAAGLHKDAAFAQQSAQAAASRARGRTELLVRLYLDKHLDAGAAPGAAKAMIASLRDGVKIEYLLD